MVQTDLEIQQAVIDELRWDTRIRGSQIGVTVDQGVVTLRGDVGSYAERLAAQEASHRVRGVRDVANEIMVRPPASFERTDTSLAKAVRHTLEWDALVPDDRITSTVSDGWVTLEGTVDHWHEREAADRAVRHLTGVRGVVDRIVVKVPDSIESEKIRGEIEAALERRADRVARRIHVDIQHGQVTLTGLVRSFDEKRAVIGAVRGTTGVGTVRDHLTVSLAPT